MNKIPEPYELEEAYETAKEKEHIRYLEEERMPEIMNRLDELEYLGAYLDEAYRDIRNYMNDDQDQVWDELDYQVQNEKDELRKEKKKIENGE